MWALFWVIPHIANLINPEENSQFHPIIIPSWLLGFTIYLHVQWEIMRRFYIVPKNNGKEHVGHDNNGEQLFSMDVQICSVPGGFSQKNNIKSSTSMGNPPTRSCRGRQALLALPSSKQRATKPGACAPLKPRSAFSRNRKDSKMFTCSTEHKHIYVYK